MTDTKPFELSGADGKLIRGDRLEGEGRQILFITGLLSKRWGNKSRALAQWCGERHWGFCCFDFRGNADSEGDFKDYTLCNWLEDIWAVVRTLDQGPPLTIVGSSLAGLAGGAGDPSGEGPAAHRAGLQHDERGPGRSRRNEGRLGITGAGWSTMTTSCIVTTRSPGSGWRKARNCERGGRRREPARSSLR